MTSLLHFVWIYEWQKVQENQMTDFKFWCEVFLRGRKHEDKLIAALPNSKQYKFHAWAWIDFAN